MALMMMLYIGGGILLILLAIPLYFRKIGPNGLYGFRVRKTMENPKIWYPVNKYGTSQLAFTGLLTATAAVGLSLVPGLSVDVYALTCLTIFAGALITGLVLTFRYMDSL